VSDVPEIDPNKVLAEIATDLVKHAAKSGKDFANAVAHKAKVKFDIGFSVYLDNLRERCGKIKTLLYRDVPVALMEHYIKTRLRKQNKDFLDQDFFDSFTPGSRTVITGTAGSGKSIFIKRLCIEFLEGRLPFIPIFIELRHLNAEDKISLLDFAANSISWHTLIFSKALLEYGLTLNKFCLILDGFDELTFALRNRYAREIHDIAKRFPNAPIVVSGRPDHSVDAWDNFSRFRVLPMQQQDAVELISKIRYDATIKQRFIQELKNGLFDRHKDFASIPLLLTMMLLTFEQYARIPDKIYLFYDEAFTTLFHRHDATKSLFTREIYSKLPIDDFKRLFSCFCFFTYFDAKYSFSESEAASYIQRAIDVEGIAVDKSKFAEDLFLSVCLLQRDGIEISFVHRSFQEYFCALFLLRNSEVDLRSSIAHVIRTYPDSAIVPMIAQMNLDLLEQKWILPFVHDLLKELKDVDLNKSPSRFLELVIQNLTFEYSKSNPKGFMFTLGIGVAHYNFYALFLLRKIYPNLIEPGSVNREQEYLADKRILVEHFGKVRPPYAIELKPTRENDKVLRLTSLTKWVSQHVKFLRRLEAHIKRSQRERKKRIGPLMRKLKK